MPNKLGRFIKVQKDRNTLMDNNNVIYKISWIVMRRGTNEKKIKRDLKTKRTH